MSRALMQHTRVAVVLSINVYRRTEQNETLRPLHLLYLTPLLLCLFTLMTWLAGLMSAINGWITCATTAADVTAKLMVVAVNSLAFAVGVNQ